VYFNVAGFSEHDTFRSNQIREGVLTREKGLRLVNAENRPRYPTIRWYLDAVNIDYAYAIATVNHMPKLYR
jgi:glutamine---fructose-6-phosphate transaminase (isomerizing)